jgi:hypothetical protein
MEKTGVVPKVNNEDENEKEGPIITHQGKQKETASGHTHSGDDHSPRPKLADQVTNDGPFKSSFEAGGTIEERNGRAADIEIAFQGKEEDREAVKEDPASHTIDQRPKNNDPPAVKDPTPDGAKQADWEGIESSLFCHTLHVMTSPFGLQL